VVPSEQPSTADWNQKGPTIVGDLAGDLSGEALSISSDGNVVAIGAKENNGAIGQVRVYEWNDPNWSQRGTALVGDSSGDRFGSSVSLSHDGTILAVGAKDHSGGGVARGRVKVYEWTGGPNWNQRGGNMDGEADDDDFGKSISLSCDGSRLAIGAPFNDVGGTDAGHVRVYEWSNPNWIQMGLAICGETAGDEFGSSVSLSYDGSILAVGAVRNSGGYMRKGRVQVCEWNAVSWNQKGGNMNGEAAHDFSGWSVSLSWDGLTVAVGAPYNDGGGGDSGHVRVYEYTTNWVPKGLDIDGHDYMDYFGWSVSLSYDGNKLAVGAPLDDDVGPYSGRVFVFAWSGSAWNPVASAIDGVAGGDKCGVSVALSGDGTTVAAGSPENDDNGASSGHVRIFHYQQ